MAVNYLSWVQKLQGLGCEQVCIVNKSYQVVGASAQDCVPSAWQKSKDDTTMINENQELANDWTKLPGVFYFFKKKWNVSFKDANTIAGQCTVGTGAEKKSYLIMAKALPDSWVVCTVTKAGGSAIPAKPKKDEKKKKKKDAKEKMKENPQKF